MKVLNRKHENHKTLKLSNFKNCHIKNKKIRLLQGVLALRFSGEVLVMFCFGHRDLQPDLYKAEALDYVVTGALLHL